MTGPAGANGVDGAQGPIGLTGPVGPQGIQGIPGTAGNAWQLTGNANSGSEAEFLGTTDASPLKFKVNNQNAGRIDQNGNTSFGYLANPTLISATGYNTAIGTQAMVDNATGVNNTALGYRSLFSLTSGNLNTAVGYQSLFENETGIQNTAIGARALYFSNSGDNNTALGYNALYNNSDGDDNTAVGNFTLSNNTNGNANTAIGRQALFFNTQNFNTAVGYQALYSNSGGTNNSSIGYQAGYFTSSGSFNSFLGNQAFYNNSTGVKNVGIGASAGLANTSGSFNIAIGEGSNFTLNNLQNAVAIGYTSVVDAFNSVRIGNTSMVSIGGQVGWSTFSDRRVKTNFQEDVPGLLFITKLRPVSYNYNLSKEAELLGVTDTSNWTGKYDIEKIRFTGFIAQEVDSAANSIGYSFSGVDKQGKIVGLRYQEFVVPLVKSVQELYLESKSKEEEILKLQEQNANQELRIRALEQKLQEILLRDN